MAQENKDELQWNSPASATALHSSFYLASQSYWFHTKRVMSLGDCGSPLKRVQTVHILLSGGITKKGTVGYKSDHFGGVFAYLPSSSDESDVIRTSRPISVQIHKEMKASSSKIPVVQVEHQDLRQIDKEAYPKFAAINDSLQKPVQAFVQQHSRAFFKFSRAISLAAEQYTHLTSSVLSVPQRESSKSGVQAALTAIRDTNYVLPDATHRIVRQMSLASRKVERALATPGTQQMLAGTRAINRLMGGAAWQSESMFRDSRFPYRPSPNNAPSPTSSAHSTTRPNSTAA